MAARMLRSLVVDLRTRTAKFNQGIDQAHRRLGGFSKSVGGLNRQLSLIGGFGTTAGIGVLIAKVKDAAVQFDSLTKRLGGTTNEWSEFKYVAAQAAIPVETFNLAMQRAIRRTAEAAQGQGEAVKALDELGLSAEKLTKAGPQEMIYALADAFGKIKDPGDRARLAMKLFDSEGVRMVEVLGKGRGAIQATQEEARRFGLSMSKDAADGMVRANAAMERLKGSFFGLAQTIVVQAGPALEAAANFIATSLPARINTAVKGLRALQHQFATLTEGPVTFRARVKERLKGLQTDVLETRAELDKLYSKGYGPQSPKVTEQERRLESLLERIQLAKDALAEGPIGGQYMGGFDKALSAGFSVQTGAPLKAIGDYQGRTVSLADANKKLNDSLRERNRLMQEGASITESLRTPVEEWADGLDRAEELLAKGAISWQTFTRYVTRTSDELSGYNEMLREGAELTREMRTPVEELADQQARWQELLEQGAISAETYNRAVAKATDALDKYQQKSRKANDTSKTMFDELKSSIEGWSRSFADAMVNATGSFNDFAENMLRQLARIAIAKSTEPLFNQFAGLVGSLFGGGNLGGAGNILANAALTGLRHSGGAVSPGRAYSTIPGEVFVPQSAGRITTPSMPSNAMGGSNVEINVIEAPGQGGETRQRQENGRNVIDVLVDKVKSDIRRDVRRGQGLGRDLESTYGLNRAAGAFS